MARRLKRRGRPRQAVRVGQRPASAPTAAQAEALFNEASRLHQAGQVGEAERLYRQLVALDPRHATGLHNLAVIACQTGRVGEAVPMFEGAIALDDGVYLFHNSLGNALKELRRFDEAAAAYARALALNPGFATGHYNLGNLHLDHGRLDAAAAAYRQAVALDPDLVEGHYNLANVLRDLGRFGEAETAYRRAVLLRPDHAQAHNNLGNLLKDTLRLDEAGEAYLAAIAARPDLAFPYSNLGVLRQLQGRLQDALDNYRRALAIDPAYPEANNNLGVVLQDLGRLDEAAAAYRRAIAQNPRYAEAHQNLARLAPLNDGSAEAEQEMALLNQLVADAGRSSAAERSQLLFALGKAWEDRGRYDRAFDCLAEANALRRASFAFDIGAAERRMAKIAEVFDAACLTRLRPGGLDSRRPIFIVGMPRSGTTLVEQIISAHPDVFGAGELAVMPALVAALRGPDGSAYPACGRSLGAEDARAFAQAYLDSLDVLAGDASRVTDKWLANFDQLGLIDAGLPNATIIHCRRDPRDVGLSCYAIGFVAGQEYAYDLGELGRYWRAYDRLMAHWRAVLPPGRMLEVPYEAVVDDLEGWARRLIAHCGLDWDDACLRFFESDRPVRTASSAQVRRPIYRDSVGRWRRFGDRLDPLLKALGEPWFEQD